MASADLTSKRENSLRSTEGGFADAAPHPLMSLLRRLAGRAVAVVTTLLGLLFLTFSMGRLLPADPVLAITGAEVSKEVYDRVYNELGLGQPVWMQFLAYVGKIATGDLGTSATTGQPILTDLLTIFPATIELAVIAMIIGAIIGVPLGITAAVRRGTIIDHVARIIALVSHSIPIFWTGLMALFIFYAKLKLVGASGRIDVFYEGLVTPVTGFLLIDAAIEQQWDVFHNALGHIIL